jgi:hypothetical protein
VEIIAIPRAANTGLAVRITHYHQWAQAIQTFHGEHGTDLATPSALAGDRHAAYHRGSQKQEQKDGQHMAVLIHTGRS